MSNDQFEHTILIVDDMPVNIDILYDFLSPYYNVKIANNGTTAIQLINNQKNIDLILLDIIMPDLDGYEVCKQLQDSNETKDIPIIFITAKSEMEDIIKGFELGAVDYVTKPFYSEELLRRVKTHLDLKDKARKLKKSNENYKELLQIVCHDLANPIHHILSILELSKNDPSLMIKMKDHINNSVQNSTEIIKLVNQLQALEEKKINLKLESVHLLSSLNESIQILNPKITDKKLVIDINVDKDLTIVVERTSFINSVLNNLLTNAIKFSYPDSKIEITAQQQNNYVNVNLRDYGIGVPENILRDIFDIQSKTSRKGTLGETGTGYGMALVKKFVTAYGGSIDIKSWEKESFPDNHGTEINLMLK